MTKKSETTPEEAAPKQPGDSSLSIVSLILGVISLTGPGLLMGIPAIILGIIALKRKQGERGLSITGIVTGAISTFFSLIIIGLMIFLIAWGATHPEASQRNDRQPMQQQEHRFDSSST